MDFIKLTLTGFILGITSVIPGISVATMAVAFNVYDRLINFIVPNVKKILETWLFWLPMVIGGVTGIVFASLIFTKLFEYYHIPTYWFFIGVIAGSIPAVYSRTLNKEVSANAQGIRLPPLSSIICAIISFGLMVLMSMLKPEEGLHVYTELTLPLFGLLMLVGALGAVAMIVPGISGAFVLLVIGFYRTILQAVSEFNIPLLIPVVLGACFGLLAGAALVRLLLAKVPEITYGAVLGLVIGSVFILYPDGFGEGIGIIASIVCLLAGFAISFVMGYTSRVK